MKAKRQNIKMKSLNGKFTIWIEFFLQWNSFLFKTFFFFFGFRVSRFLAPASLLLLYYFMKSLCRGPELQIRDAYRFLFIYCTSFSTSLCTECSGAVAENPNKTSRPSGDVVSLCPTRRFSGFHRTNWNLPASPLYFIFPLHLFSASHCSQFWILLGSRLQYWSTTVE
jgi:hypothetical protein